MIDEAATVDQIARQDIWVPVLKPAPERWLDVELVIEASAFSFIWRSTLKEFRHILERQGAFRTVRSWMLGEKGGVPRIWPGHQDEHSGHGRSLDELISSSGRSVILMVSDCRSSLWTGTVRDPQCDKAQPHDLYGWLHRLNQKNPTAIVQLLPERLWRESALGMGYGLRVHSRFPCVTNAHLVMDNVPPWEQIEPPDALLVPVIPLVAQALKQWAQVIAGRSDRQVSARLFDLSWVGDAERPRSRSSRFGNNTSAEERVEYFFATASPLAQQLAMMMAVVPVDLSVVHLIQDTLLKESTYVHVAEVYSSGLLKPVNSATNGDDVQYAFVPGVRDILNQVTPVEDVKDVLHELSQAIAERLNLPPIKHFSALLLPQKEWSQSQQDAILPFARITIDVLSQLGGDFAELANVVKEGANAWLVESEPPLFPPSQGLEFDTARYQESTTPSFPPLQTRSLQVLTIEEDSSTPPIQTVDFEYVTLEQHQEQWEPVRHPAQCRQYIEVLTEQIGLAMVFIPAGTFMMGEEDSAHEVMSLNLLFDVLIGYLSVNQNS